MICFGVYISGAFVLSLLTLFFFFLNSVCLFPDERIKNKKKNKTNNKPPPKNNIARSNQQRKQTPDNYTINNVSCVSSHLKKFLDPNGAALIIPTSIFRPCRDYHDTSQ